ncbi:putative ribonuclease H-like domain-containing protein [Tanacetum coccineum]|uniref:Ribonuclease H-like domain-containing protein n=1 Tax=Tanacetum coccineum TaxID=301880 RepID=A0ABQ5FBX6_9ASTR
MTHPSPKRNMIPKAVLMRSDLVLLTTARPVNTAQPRSTVNRNMSYLTNFEEINGGYVAFGGNPKGGKITGRVPRKNNMYSVDLKNIVPKGGLTCLFAKATSDESKLWHKRLGHINFKTMNKLVKGNLVRGLPSKLFENDQTCVACQKGKQHRASCKSKTVSSISHPLHMLHMDLFGPTFVKNLMKKMYCLVVTDDYNRFSWVLFLANKDETSGILKSFITGVENLIDQRVKVIRCDNGTKFKNKGMNQFCENIESGPNWLFDIDSLTKSMNYKPVITENQSNGMRHKACDVSSPDAGFKPSGDNEKKVTEEPGKEGGDSSNDQEKEDNINSNNNVNTASTNEVNAVSAKTSIELPDDLNMPELEDIVYSNDDEDVGAEADMNILNTFMPVSPIPTTRIHKDHPVYWRLEFSTSNKKNDKEFGRTCLYRFSLQRTNIRFSQLVVCLLSITRRTQKGTKWVYRNKKDERGIVIKNKARLVAQGYTQEEGIDYDEVFAYVARIEAIRLFLAYASFKDFVVYHMDVKSAFLYGKIEEEVYVCQPPGFEDPDFPDRVYKVEKALYGLHQDLRACKHTYGNSKPLLKDEDGEEVDVHLYRLMIGSLMCLTSLRPNIMFAVCAYARYQVNPKVSHLYAVKRIFRYLKGQPKLGLWYPKDSPFDLVAYTYSDYAGASLDKKSTIGAQEEMGEGSTNLTDPHHAPIITQPSSSQPQKKHKSRRPKEKDTEVPQSSVPSDLTNVADEDSMTLKELMDFCTNLQQRVLDLENTKTAQAQEITSLKKRVNKLENKGGSRTHKLKRLYKVGRSARIVSSDEASLGDQEDASKQRRKIDDIDKDIEITLVDETQGKHDDDIMFDVSDLAGEEVFVTVQGVPDSKKDDALQVNTAAITVSTASTIPVCAATITEDEITLAQALTELKSVKPKMKKKDQISFDEQEAIRLQSEFDKEVRLAREKDEANVALIEEWNDIQAKIDVDYHLAQRLQTQEQEELTIEERAKLIDWMEPRFKETKAFDSIKKLFDKAVKRVNTFVDMDTELVKESSKKAGAEMAQESSSKRTGDELEQESIKKQKVYDDQETTKMKEHIEVVPDEEEVAIDAIPLATKPPSIVDFKILKEEKISYFQIIRADGSSKRYSAFIHMLRSFDMEDLETL